MKKLLWSLTTLIGSMSFGVPQIVDPLRALTLALQEHNVESVKNILSAHPELLNAQKFSYAEPVVHEQVEGTPLHAAIATYKKPHHEKSMAIIQFLIEEGAQLDRENTHGVTPLLEAIMRNNLEAAQLLIEAGAQVNHRAAYDSLMLKQGETPLFKAVAVGNSALVRFLLEHGADPSIANSAGDTVYGLARNKLKQHPDSTDYKIISQLLYEKLPSRWKKIQEKILNIF
jgi:hypothetical protein